MKKENKKFLIMTVIKHPISICKGVYNGVRKARARAYTPRPNLTIDQVFEELDEKLDDIRRRYPVL